ncbi:MAG: PP2C family protein-serine/threonine phosphatase [Thermomicrobiales bacterium]
MVVEQQVAPAVIDELVITAGSRTAAAGRLENEDAVLVLDLPALAGDAGSEPGYLLAVADGMGGHERGEVASQLAIETLASVVRESSETDTAALLKQAFRRANEAIFADGHGDGDTGGMGTTLVTAVVRGKYLTIANVGDSRAYLLRSRRINQITRDHSLVGEQVARGKLSAEEARESPRRNILMQALGHRPKLDAKMPDIFELVLLAEDRLLLCSDGFYDVVGDDDFVSVLSSGEPELAASSLVDVAIERGTSDNVSAVVVQVEAAKELVAREREAAAVPEGRGSQVVLLVILLGVVLFIAIVIGASTLL